MLGSSHLQEIKTWARENWEAKLKVKKRKSRGGKSGIVVWLLCDCCGTVVGLLWDCCWTVGASGWEEEETLAEHKGQWEDRSSSWKEALISSPGADVCCHVSSNQGRAHVLCVSQTSSPCPWTTHTHTVQNLKAAFTDVAPGRSKMWLKELRSRWDVWQQGFEKCNVEFHERPLGLLLSWIAAEEVVSSWSGFHTCAGYISFPKFVWKKSLKFQIASFSLVWLKMHVFVVKKKKHSSTNWKRPYNTKTILWWVAIFVLWFDCE